jgi:replication factor A1
VPSVIPPAAKVRLLGVKARTNQQELEVHGNESTAIKIDSSQDLEPVVFRVLSSMKNESGQRMILGVNKQKQILTIVDGTGVTASFAQGDVLECMPSKMYGSNITMDADSFVRKIEADGIPQLPDLRTKIADVKPDNNYYCIEAIILKAPERRNIQTKTGESITLAEMYVEDDTAQIWVKGWRNQARLLDECSIGEIVSVSGAIAKPGLEGRTELSLTPFSMIKKKG